MNTIIMHYVKNEHEARECFWAVKNAIKDEIKEGRENFKSYGFSYTGHNVTVCKNKNSYTVYMQDN